MMSVRVSSKHRVFQVDYNEHKSKRETYFTVPSTTVTPKGKNASFLYRAVDFDPKTRLSFNDSFDSMRCCCSGNKITEMRTASRRESNRSSIDPNEEEFNVSLWLNDLFDGYESVNEEKGSESRDIHFFSRTVHSEEIRTSRPQKMPSSQRNTTRTREDKLNLLPNHLKNLMSALCLVKR